MRGDSECPFMAYTNTKWCKSCLAQTLHVWPALCRASSKGQTSTPKAVVTANSQAAATTLGGDVTPLKRHMRVAYRILPHAQTTYHARTQRLGARGSMSPYTAVLWAVPHDGSDPSSELGRRGQFAGRCMPPEFADKILPVMRHSHTAQEYNTTHTLPGWPRSRCGHAPWPHGHLDK